MGCLQYVADSWRFAGRLVFIFYADGYAFRRKLYGRVVKRINEPCLLPTRLKDLIVSMVKEKIDPRLCLRLWPAIASFVTTPRPQKEIRCLKSRPLNKWELPTNGMKQAEFGGAGTWVAQRGAGKGQGTSCECHGGKGQA